MGGLAIVGSGVGLGRTLAVDQVFPDRWRDTFPILYENQLPIGGLISGFGALITAGIISGLLSCGANKGLISSILYPVLVFNIELGLELISTPIMTPIMIVFYNTCLAQLEFPVKRSVRVRVT